MKSNPAYMQTFNKVLIIPPITKSKFIVLPFDVTHSSGPYAFGIKLDAIPGRLHLTSTINSFVKGLHRGFCFYLLTHAIPTESQILDIDAMESVKH